MKNIIINKGPLLSEHIVKHLELMAYIQYDDGGEWYHLIVPNDMKIHYAEGKQGVFEANNVISLWFVLPEYPLDETEEEQE